MKPDASATRPALILGGAGFIGTNLADRLCREGRPVIVYDSLVRPGTERNLEWLVGQHGDLVRPLVADIRERPALHAAVANAEVVFHLAAQVAVTTSLQSPREDFEVNLGATVQLLELLREHRAPPPLIFASTNKVYGDLGGVDLELTPQGYQPVDLPLRRFGVGEDQPLSFHTPYGCSKGAADQYVLDYARSFGLRTAVLRMSCIYGEHQQGNEDQGWVAHFVRQALRGEAITLYGDGQQVRDILAVSDAVSAYLAAWRAIDRVSGRAFNLGGGPTNAVSLRQVIDQIGQATGRPLEVQHGPWRAGDQRYFVSDARAAREALALPPPLGWHQGLDRLIDWCALADRLRLEEAAA